MRPGQNKRMRGRNNRKGPNPLTRTYESNGPDVKIRGTAHHVAEKYLQLARDAQSSGDPVMAESYLQHAEHYFRLIAAAQLAQQQAQIGFRSPNEAEADDFDDDDGGIPDRFSSPITTTNYPPQQQPYPNQQPHPSTQPQPYVDRPAFGGDAAPLAQGQGGQPERQPRQERHFNDRNNGGNGQGRDQNRQRRGGRDFRAERPEFNDQPTVNLPAFITAPTRATPEGSEQPQEEREHANGGGGYHLRPRRRRRNPEDSMGEGEVSATTSET
jgi:Domain of unknown function (DUF4167)